MLIRKQMTIKKQMFYSNLMMIIFPIIILVIAVRIFSHIFLKNYLFVLLETQGIPINELKAIFESGNFTPVTIAFGLATVLIVATIVAVNIFFTNRMMKKLMVPIDRLYDGAQRIQDGNLNEDILYSDFVELDKVCAAFNDMQHQLKANIEQNKKYEQSRNEMLAGISHDLRTPLTSIKSYVKGLQDGVPKSLEKEKEYLDVLYRKACGMESLIEQLFLFSKLETGNLPFHFRTLEIQEYMATTLDTLEGELRKFNTSLTLNNNCGRELVLIDPEHMDRVIENILYNSVKYNSGKRINITVTLVKHNNDIVIHLHDDGVGVCDEQISYLFDSFYRVDDSRSEDGSGLGLTIAKNIVEAHRGKISAKNDNGLEVVIELPVIKEDEQ